MSRHGRVRRAGARRVAPAIVVEWHIPNAALGYVFGAGNFGVLIGALAFSMAADTIGRRPVLMAATMFFAAMTLLTARATSIPQLRGCRFISGIVTRINIDAPTILPEKIEETLISGAFLRFPRDAVSGGPQQKCHLTRDH